MTPGDSQLGQSTIPNDMNSSRGNGDFWKERSPILMPVTARFFSPIQDLEDRTILKNTSKREDVFGASTTALAT
ncbi:MAG: hypothetical protein DMG50_05135 [Acidobacteria bacterium]|nr:MAG: hypothetical protein DMG50_05135 [Acidobacteriota bacterium]